MFSIIVDQVIQDCSQLEKQVSELFMQMMELEQAKKELQRLSYMAELVARLEHQYSQMDYQYNVLRQMMLALNKTILNYLSCENRICDNGEQNVILYRRQEIGVNDFSDIFNILSGI